MLFWLLPLILILGGALFVFNSQMFERNVPVVRSVPVIHWNLKGTVPLVIEDESAIKSYKVSLLDDQRIVTLAEGKNTGEKRLELELEYPKNTFYANGEAKLLIEAEDASLWNFMAGNRVKMEIPVVVDRKPPFVNIIGKSYGINKGGSALVVFEARDEHPKKIYVTTSGDRTFKVQPFYKENFYVALIARDVRDEKFRAYVVAEDQAGNTVRSFIPFYNKKKNYRVSTIELKENFLDGKIAELFHEFYQPSAEGGEMESKTDKFRFVNETLRKANEEVIRGLTTDYPEVPVEDFHIAPFEPLRNGAAVASYGDHRKFFYNKQPVSESYHLGIDLASTRQADIVATNGGTVTFAQLNGIYGHMPLIHHGLGLYSLYGHCSNVFVTEGQHVAAGEVIGKTGATGLALGDHLHFGMVVQGVEVRPAEWMDRKWIKDNIEGVLAEARKTIDGGA